MIAYIIGEITDIEENAVLIESGAIGYQVFVPSSVAMTVQTGSRVKLHTYLNVREDAMTLYGFSSKDELKLFRLMLGVSGIGPKGALGILSALTPDELRLAVLSEDAKTIAKAPGIGNKTAMKLLIELKDKLKIEEIFVSSADTPQSEYGDSRESELRNEALQAMVALGYSQGEAAKAVKAAKITEDSTASDLVKEALRNIL